MIRYSGVAAMQDSEKKPVALSAQLLSVRQANGGRGSVIGSIFRTSVYRYHPDAIYTDDVIPSQLAGFRKIRDCLIAVQRSMV